jgi:hypothetical protein
MRNILLLAILSCFLFPPLFAQVSSDTGKELYRNYCASCHSRDMRSAGTGPALGGAEEMWDSRENLYAWIRNSQAMIAAGHPRAVELWNTYKHIMTAFPNLTDDEIESILVYINDVYTAVPSGPTVGVAGAPVGAKQESKWLYPSLLALLALIALFLAKIIIDLRKIQVAKDGSGEEVKSLWQNLSSKSVVTMLIFALVILGGYTTVNKAINLGRQQNYAPEQPIKFSHATHSGLHKIDCQYCHDGARRSKQSIIPAANTCMNCHRAIKVGSEYGTAEITKIYASIGYNPIENVYLENYEDMSHEEIKKLYTKWIADSYLEEKELPALDFDGEQFVENQWKDIVSSLTNEQKTKIQGPIEWVRIHNLPDHAYFNHAQHVTVGKVECQTCHGPVEEMEVVHQHSTLSMGWCINCHRQSEVKFSGNDYYQSYERFHTEMAEGKRDKVTVADIGGLECQKCHY